MKKVIFVVALILVALAALPFYSGYRVKLATQQIVDSVNDYPGYEARVDEHTGGWLKSSAKIIVKLATILPTSIGSASADQPSAAPVEIELPVELEFAHGPLLFNDVATFGWFSFQSVLDKEVSETAKGQLVLRDAESLANVGGYVNLTGELNFGAEIAAFTYTESSPETETELVFEGANSQGVMTTAGLLLGEMALGALNFTTDDGSDLTVSPSAMAFSADYGRKVSSTLMPSEFSYTIAKVDGNIQGKALLLEDLVMSAVIELAQEAPIFDMIFDLSVDQFSADDHVLSDGKLSLSYDNISIALYDAYIDLTEEMLAQGAVQPDFSKLLSDEQIKTTLQYNPGFSIQNLQATVAEGDFKGDLKFALQPLQNFDPAFVKQNPAVLMQFATVSLNMAGDKPLVYKLMEPKVRLSVQTQLEASGQSQNMTNEEVDSLVEESVVASIQHMVQQGLVIEENDQYLTSFSLVAGGAKINGVDFPLDALLGSVQ